MACRFSRIADTLLQRWSNVFLQDIGHFVTSIYNSIAKLTSASTSDFHGSISSLGGGFRNLIRSASGCLRGGFRTFAGSFRNGVNTFSCPFATAFAPSEATFAMSLPLSCRNFPASAAAEPICSNGLNPISHASFNANGQKPPLCASSAHSFFDLL